MWLQDHAGSRGKEWHQSFPDWLFYTWPESDTVYYIIVRSYFITCIWQLLLCYIMVSDSKVITLDKQNDRDTKVLNVKCWILELAISYRS